MARKLYESLPATPGVYLMKNRVGAVIYVGKAGNLKRRVSSYFLRAHDSRLERLIRQVAKIDFEKTETAIEALILEAKIIRKLRPPFNVKEKDDKSFLYVEFTREKFPRILLVRGKDPADGARFGPFTSASSIREALRLLRRIFPFHTHPPEQIGKFKRPCFDAQIGLCPGTCVDAVSRSDYIKNILRLRLMFQGKKRLLLKGLEREMQAAAKRTEFERAGDLRGQIRALQHIQDVSLLKEDEFIEPGLVQRIEGYDISNISGTSAVGSMVVFENNKPKKSDYRKFRIRTVLQADDVGMLMEVLRRRFAHAAIQGVASSGTEWWPLPALVLVDGGTGQVNAARKVLNELGLRLPVVGLAKGPERKKNEKIGEIPPGFSLKTLVRVRDEAHRFAIAYHKNLRGRNFLKKTLG